jgi:hypothetical protein
MEEAMFAIRCSRCGLRFTWKPLVFEDYTFCCEEHRAAWRARWEALDLEEAKKQTKRRE